MKAVVIGSGFGGLATAALLAHQGLEVMVLEKNSEIGGKARVFTKNGYKFDMGPSWYLMPEVFEEFFKSLGKNVSDYYELKPLNPSFRIYTTTHVSNVMKDPEENRELYNGFEKDGYLKFQKYMADTKKLYINTMGTLLYREYGSKISMAKPSILSKAIGIRMFKSISKFNEKYFQSREMRDIMDFSSIFLGGTPDNIPAPYGLVNYSIFQHGVFYPEGGFGSVVHGMEKICNEFGVKFRTGFEVLSSEIKDGRMMSVSSSESTEEGDLFVFNSDYVFTDSKIIDRNYANFGKKYWDKAVVAPSAILAYVGVKGDIPLDHHNIFMGEDSALNYKSISEMDTSIPESFSFYASLRSRSDSSVAPEGNSTLFLLIPVSPNFRDSPSISEKYATAALERISKSTGFNLANAIEFLKIYRRENFTEDYNAFRGTAFGLSQTLGQTAGFRPNMRNRKVKNVFYAGQYTHPGIGVPMVLIAAHIVASIIREEYLPHKLS